MRARSGYHLWLGRAGRILHVAFAGIVVLSLTTPVVAADRASPEVGTQFIVDLADRAARVMQEPGQALAAREEALRALLRDAFAIEFISRVALGSHWRELPEADRAAYSELFGEFLLRTYGTKLAAFERDRFGVTGASPRGKQDLVVDTQIVQPSGPPIRAGWRVRLIDGQPRIIDILVEGVSMALNQRREFDSVLSRQGLDGLLEMLRARTQRLPVEGPEK